MNKPQRVLHWLVTILACTFTFTSCEWDNNDNNFVEKQKPEESILIGIDLASVNPEEVIQIPNGTALYYTVHSGGKDIVNQLYFLDGELLTNDISWGWNSFDDQHSVTINRPESEIDNQVHDLKLVMLIDTESKSLASYMGYEFYVGELNFKIRFTNKYNYGIPMRQSLSSNKLKVEWDKPTEYEVEGYELYSNPNLLYPQQLLTTIKDPNITSYVDDQYAYGNHTYTVKPIVKNGLYISSAGSILVDYNAITQDHLSAELLANGNMLLKWANPNPYPAKYVVECNNQVYKLANGVTQLEIPQQEFPTWNNSMKVYVLPPSANSDSYEDYSRAYLDVQYNSLSQSIYHTDVTVDYNTKSIFVLGENKNWNSRALVNSYSFAGVGLTPISSKDLSYSAYSRGEITISASGKAAVKDYNSKIHIYESRSFDTEISNFQLEYNMLSYQITNNHFIYTDVNSLIVRDINTMAEVNRKTYGQFYTHLTSAVSSDYKHIFIYASGNGDESPWRRTFSFDGNELTEINFTEGAEIEFMHPNPLNASQMYIQNASTFTLLDIPSNAAIKTVAGWYLSSDPVTGNVLMYNMTDWSLEVLNKTLDKKLFSIKSHSMSYMNKAILVNNIIYKDGVYVDISKVIKQ